MISVSKALRKMVERLRPIPSSPDRPMSTREDARRQLQEAQRLERQAKMLGVDVDLHRAGHNRA